MVGKTETTISLLVDAKAHKNIRDYVVIKDVQVNAATSGRSSPYGAVTDVVYVAAFMFVATEVIWLSLLGTYPTGTSRRLHCQGFPIENPQHEPGRTG